MTAAQRPGAATITYIGFETLDPDILTFVYGPEQAYEFVTPVPVLAARNETTGTLDFLPPVSRYAADPRWRENPVMEGVAPGWGYMGTGPGMAAAAILKHHLGEPVPVRAVQAFKAEVIAPIVDPFTHAPAERLWLPGAAVAAWVTQRAVPHGLLEFDLLDQLTRRQAIGQAGEADPAGDGGDADLGLGEIDGSGS
jgi:hypothetical protein